jgi:hypothetical protein
MRKWLRNNKIWFETVAALLLSIAAITISITSVVEMKRQTRITELQMLPKFTISAHQEKSGRNGDIYDDENIYVRNNGGYFIDFKIEVATVLNIKQIFKTPFEVKLKDVILFNYYSGQAYNSGSIISPVAIKGYENNHKFANLLMEYRQRSCEVDNDGGGDLWIDRYVKIKYVDFLKKERTEYYKVELIYGSSLISQTDGEKIFKRKKDITNGVDFDRLNLDLLCSIIRDS